MDKTYLDLDNQNLGSIDYIPEGVNFLSCGNNELKSLPELPEGLIMLSCSNNKLTKLPKLPSTLQYLFCNDNKLTKLPKLPPNLLELICYNNKLTIFPKIPSSLSSLDITDNMIERMPNLANNEDLLLARFERNPCTESMYNVSELDTRNISKSHGVYYLTLKKGTVLFHNTTSYDSYSEIYLGFKNKESYVLNPDHQSYFFTHPFRVGYGDITTIVALQNDVKIFLGVLPSNYTKPDLRKEFYKECSNYSRYECLKKEHDYHDVFGWITQDHNSRPYTHHGETYNFNKYYQYISYYKNIDGYIDRTEVQLYPRKVRENEDVVVKTDDDIGYINDHIDEFNYKTICVFDNSDFKVYKKYIDELLSNNGFTNSMGTFHMYKDEVSNDGLYMIR